MQDGIEVIGRKFFQHRDHRQAAHEFRFKPELDQVFRGYLFEEGAILVPGSEFAAKADFLLADALLDDFIHPVEGPADDKQDVAGIEGALFLFAGTAVVFDSLNLGDRVMGHFQVHFGFFHGFEQGPLDAGAGHVRPAPGKPGGGDFINFIDINNAVLGQFQIVPGRIHQVSDQVFDIAAHVARFAELGGITFDKGNPDFLGNEFNQVGLAHSGGTDQNNVIFDGAHPGFRVASHLQGMADAVEMGTHLGSQNTLGEILLDNVLIQKGFQLLWL